MHIAFCLLFLLTFSYQSWNFKETWMKPIIITSTCMSSKTSDTASSCILYRVLTQYYQVHILSFQISVARFHIWTPMQMWLTQMLQSIQQPFTPVRLDIIMLTLMRVRPLLASTWVPASCLNGVLSYFVKVWLYTWFFPPICWSWCLMPNR